eukprot:scaffold4099_cov98-Cylindrotheca_fusiformis.AAC.6
MESSLTMEWGRSPSGMRKLIPILCVSMSRSGSNNSSIIRSNYYFFLKPTTSTKSKDQKWSREATNRSYDPNTSKTFIHPCIVREEIKTKSLSAHRRIDPPLPWRKSIGIQEARLRMGWCDGIAE